MTDSHRKKAGQLCLQHILLVALPTLISSFSTLHSTPRNYVSPAKTLRTRIVALHNSPNDCENENHVPGTSTRRDILVQGVSSTIATAGLFGMKSVAFAESGGIGTDPSSPIAVVGASGRCGKMAMEALVRDKLYARGVTRSGRTVLPSSSDYASYAAGDVTSLSSLTDALKGCSGVIFAASASKNGGDAAHVDYLGVANIAKACIANSIPRLVVISSLAVTRPDSLGFKITNVFGRIMDYKVAGEVELRKIYASAPPSLSYTILRPGGLSDAPAEGPLSLISSQGDLLSGEVSRQDVSELCVAAVQRTDIPNTTLELFNKKGLGRSVKKLPADDKMALLKHEGVGSYSALLNGLYSDSDMGETFGDIISGYSGTKVESLESLV